MMTKDAKQKALTQEQLAELKLNEIISLYRQMIRTARKDTAERARLIHKLSELQNDDGSFRVIHASHCDSDIRIAFICFPTYYATAAMMFAMKIDGDNANVENALKNGLSYALQNHMAGYGMNATAQQIKALRIYKEAGLYDWIKMYGKNFPDFTDMIHEVIDHYCDCLRNGNTRTNEEVDFTEEFQQEVDDYNYAFAGNIWYAAYGSNMNYSRFMKYISRCTDKTEPGKTKAVFLPHNIYFAYKSSRWNHKGVAFLDDTCKGQSFGRMYLITNEQFAEIQKMEGHIYRKRVLLGKEEGTPVYTFTAPSKRTDIESPDPAYTETILQGLREAYPEVSELVLTVYLYKHGILQENDFQVLTFIRHSEHGVSLRAISDHTISMPGVRTAIKKLSDYQLIRQDGRSIHAGHTLLSPEAIVYTCRKKRELIDLLIMG